ncbi:cell surface glycoprotein 1-like [Macrobrachium nipponense]|uniref:cell surface glycoprotein 1-like n=1 Tax=Macrobrachium nipponense TaxID=159736 RepID=UPI0030C825D0
MALTVTIAARDYGLKNDVKEALTVTSANRERRLRNDLKRALTVTSATREHVLRNGLKRALALKMIKGKTDDGQDNELGRTLDFRHGRLGDTMRRTHSPSPTLASVLTLLLVLGAVTCSPVPSDLPALSDSAHIEVTHEVRHVTYEVSEEVSEATASSHIPSDVPPEEDPPIPTVTTPHTALEEEHPQDDNISEKGQESQESEGEISQEASPEPEVAVGEETKSEEKETEVTQEGTEVTVSEDKESDSENISESEDSSVESSELVPESHVFLSNNNENKQEDSEIVAEETEATVLTPSENPADEVHSEHVSEENTDLTESQPTEPVEPEPTSPVESEPTIPVESEPTIPVESEPTVPVESEPTVPVESEPTEPVEPEPTSHVESEAIDPVETEHIDPVWAKLSDHAELEPISPAEGEPTSQDEAESHIEAELTSKIVVEPTVPLVDEHTSSDEAEHIIPEGDETASQVEEEAQLAGGDLTDGAENDNSDLIVSDEDHHVSGGEVFEEIPSQNSQEVADSSEFLETEKRTDDIDLPVHKAALEESSNEASDVAAPEGDTARESRVYIAYEEPSHHEGPKEEDSTIPEQEESHEENESKPANSGLESLSMTSPTPESLPDDVLDVDDLEKEEALSEEYPEYPEEAVLPDIPELDSQEENSTLTADAEEPDVVPDVVINPPSSSVAPVPGDEFTESYNDPLEESGNLPDFDVTHEQLPSKTYPHPEETQLIPEKTHETYVSMLEGDSSDLAAGDHMLEVDSGSPRVLPPQQEQISAAAPSALTPGCIVAIVFGVLISLVVILGVGGFMIWQRRTQNRPKVLGNDQGYAGSDSGGYIDDQGNASQGSQGQQIFIRLKTLKPSLPASAAGMLKSLPNMPKIAPMNMPNFNQIITKRESGGSNQPGQ